MIAVDLGRTAYAAALELQHRLVDARTADRIDDTLLVCEHDPVYTAGRRADLSHVLDASTIPVVRADRGGDVSYHGPGQVVVYPIIRLAGPRRVRAYIETLQTACVRVATDYGVIAHTDASRPGVWVGDDKLVAIGVRVQRGATSHGLAFNVAPDLSHYAGIVACGITDGGVCSLASLGVRTTMAAVGTGLVDALAGGLERPVRWATTDELDDAAHAA